MEKSKRWSLFRKARCILLSPSEKESMMNMESTTEILEDNRSRGNFGSKFAAQNVCLRLDRFSRMDSVTSSNEVQDRIPNPFKKDEERTSCTTHLTPSMCAFDGQFISERRTKSDVDQCNDCRSKTAQKARDLLSKQDFDGYPVDLPSSFFEGKQGSTMNLLENELSRLQLINEDHCNVSFAQLKIKQGKANVVFNRVRRSNFTSLVPQREEREMQKSPFGRESISSAETHSTKRIVYPYTALISKAAYAIGSSTTRYFCLQTAYSFINIRQWIEDPSAM